MKTINLKKTGITTIVFAFIISAFYFVLKNAEKRVTNLKDYEKYLVQNDSTSNTIDKEISFWQKKINNNPNDIIAKSKMASELTKRFSHKGTIQDVHTADSLWQVVNKLNRNNSSSTFRALAANCITQHQFKQAKLYIDSALILGDNKYESLLLSSDIELELGNLTIAENILQQLNKKSFDVLIRMAKIKDHRGNLEGAIKLMEKALDEIKNNNNEVLKNWTLSNLGDMYGHNNQYKKSYNCYLKVLQSNATYYHCLKGIAWIAYAHDKNVVAAKKVLNYLNKYHPIPDYALLLAEIEGFEKNEIAKSKHLVAFTKMTKDKYYGDMYNKYNFYINTDEFKNVNEALRIANIEVSNRPTPESYSLLSWAYYLNGDEINALKISKTFVENKCIEPDVLANMAIVYKATGETKLAKIFYKDAMESAYELGPEKINNIKKLYNAL